MAHTPQWPKFRDRRHAGQLLAQQLTQHLAQRFLPGADAALANAALRVLALPRGGIPIGFEVAQQLNVPLDVCLVRKLGMPRNRELAMGAIAEDGNIVWNQGVIDRFQISPTLLQGVIDQEQAELLKRAQLYQPYRPESPPSWTNHTVILLDDGIATGATFQAAINTFQIRNPAHLIVATPVASPTAFEQFSGLELVCLIQPDPFQAVGHWYDDFTHVSDRTVCRLLALANPYAELTY